MAELMANMLDGAGTGDDSYGSDGNSNVTIEMLDFDYVRQCEKADELRGIVNVLKSGKEGFYPELLKEAEGKLLSVLPEKERKKYLALFSTATPMEISEAEEDILNWEDSIARTDNILRTKVSTDCEAAPKSKSRTPAVRGQFEENDNIAANTRHVNASSGNQTCGTSSTEKKSERLSGYNFRAWEKFDVDAAIADVDDEERQREERLKENAQKYRELRDVNAKKRMEVHDKEMEKLRSLLEADSMTPTERRLRSAREKEKGNECFKAQEYEEAVRNYSKSICLAPENPVMYCNRALVYLKQNNFQSAEDDCTMAIERNDKYLKAWTRRGTTRFKMGKYADSIQDLREAKALDPENIEILGLLKKSEEKYLEVEGKHYSDHIGRGGQFSCCSKKLTVSFNQSTNLESFFRDVGKLPTKDAKISKGACVMKYPKKVDEHYDTSGKLSDGKFIPSERYSGARAGYVFKTGSEGLGYYEDGLCQKSIEEKKAKTSEFTRVAIVDDDDDDVDNNGAKDRDSREDCLIESDSKIESTNSGLTRISIVDEDEEKEEEENEIIDYHCNGLTRIAISEEDDDDESININESENLKNLGNELMAQKKIEKAIELYTQSIHRNPRCFAAFNNRSMAYLQIASFENAVNDASRVVDSREPNLVPKALYRRAQGYVALAMMEEALQDIDELIQLDSTNSAALKLREEIMSCKDKNKVTNLEMDIENLHTKALDCVSDGNAQEGIGHLKNIISKLDSLDDKSEGKTTMGTSNEGDDMYLSTLLLLGKCFSCVDDNKSALATYDKLLGRYPKHFKGYLRRADAQFTLGNLQAAKSDVLCALKIDPVNSEALQLADTISRVEEENKKVAKHKRIASEESKKAESERFKIEGNDAVKRLEFQEAIKLYTEAIHLNPLNLAAIGNRAQVYLKLSRFVDAERDACTVLNFISHNKSGDDMDALQVKALFRRGLARRSMGGLANLEKSLVDFKEIVSMEPSNKSATLETTRTEQLIKEMKKSSASSANGKNSSTTSKKEGSFMMSALQTTRKPRPKIEEEQNDVVFPPALPPKEEKEKIEEIPRGPGNKTTTKSPLKKSPMKAPTVPTEQPKNVYELERIWRGLKTHPELFAKYITTLKSSTIKKVFNDNVSSDLYSSLFEVCSKFVADSSPKDALRVLESLTMMKGFELTSSLWPKQDMQRIEEVLSKVSSSNVVTPNKISALKEIYFK